MLLPLPPWLRRRYVPMFGDLDYDVTCAYKVTCQAQARDTHPWCTLWSIPRS
jgi:hypothetical protein